MESEGDKKLKSNWKLCIARFLNLSKTAAHSEAEFTHLHHANETGLREGEGWGHH